MAFLTTVNPIVTIWYTWQRALFGNDQFARISIEAKQNFPSNVDYEDY